MTDTLLNGTYAPLQTVLPSYPYLQYSDDDNIAAFFSAYNDLAQSYLDWFNTTPLSVYAPTQTVFPILYTSDGELLLTSDGQYLTFSEQVAPAVSGALLDWVGEGIYGVSRPVISTLTTAIIAGMNTVPMNTVPMNNLTQVQSGTAEIASDDIYRRTLTWILFKGDGVQASIPWLRRRVARFLYGQNGTDVSINEDLNVRIIRQNLPASGAMAMYPMNTQAMNTLVPSGELLKRSLEIQIPTSTTAQQFLSLLREGYLPTPLQLTLTVTLT